MNLEALKTARARQDGGRCQKVAYQSKPIIIMSLATLRGSCDSDSGRYKNSDDCD